MRPLACCFSRFNCGHLFTSATVKAPEGGRPQAQILAQQARRSAPSSNSNSGIAVGQNKTLIKAATSRQPGPCSVGPCGSARPEMEERRLDRGYRPVRRYMYEPLATVPDVRDRFYGETFAPVVRPIKHSVRARVRRGWPPRRRGHRCRRDAVPLVPRAKVDVR